MGIRMVREPSAYYNARQGASYYAEDDVNLTTSLGTLSSDTSAILINLVYGKIILNNTIYLVSINDMEMTSDMKNYNSVTNIDDIIPFRYAYGNQDGYVIGKGTEISPTIEGNTFRINSGRVVLQGVETDIDANGVSFTIDNSSETRYFVAYYEVNLATQATAIRLSDYSTNGYPSIDTGDDLTANSSGIARTELYRFTATSGVISNVTKTAKAIEYSGTALVGYDINKGTVEERLTALGFKTGTIAFNYGNGSQPVTFKRQGNYVIMTGTIAFDNPTDLYNFFIGNTNYTIGVIPKEFRPKYTVDFNIGASFSGNIYTGLNTSPITLALSARIRISPTNGEVRMVKNTNIVQSVYPQSWGTFANVVINCGYEADPLI